MSDMEKPTECYLDTSLLFGWFKHIISKKPKTSEPQIISFLKQHPEVKTFISSMTAAEIVERSRKDLAKQNLSLIQIKKVVEKMQQILGFKIIDFYVATDGKEEIKDIRLNARNIINLTFLGKDVKDAIHVEIARQNDLWWIARDDCTGTMEEIYPKIMTAKKLMKQYE
ncbi:MAG: hypothetical protein HZB67_01605 [Candidatus Aenigmarchaeota archaeon]|nr:hypothetical protein [Candidatus Aenigmarchaeota archaeon]